MQYRIVADEPLRSLLEKRIKAFAEVYGALDRLVAFEPGSNPPMSMARGIAVERARLVLANFEELK